LQIPDVGQDICVKHAAALYNKYKTLCNYQMFYLSTDAQENFFKNNIKIYIKTASTYFRLIIITERIIRAC
jgi:hypothetical protein